MKRHHDDEPRPRRIKYLSHTLADGKEIYRFKYADEEQAKEDLRSLLPEQLPYRLLHSDEFRDPEVAEIALAWARRRLAKYGFVYTGLIHEGYAILVDWPKWYDRTAEEEMRIASDTYAPMLALDSNSSYGKRRAKHKKTGIADEYFTAPEYAYLRVAFPERYGLLEGDEELVRKLHEQAYRDRDERRRRRL